MQSSAAFKAACLTAGLATAWAPHGLPEAEAGTIQVNLNFGTSTQTDVQDVYLGLLLTNSTFQVFALDTAGYSIPTTLLASDVAGYVAIGRTSPPIGEDPHLWVSFGDFDAADAAAGVAFDTVFASSLSPGESEAVIGAQLMSNAAALYAGSSFINRLLNRVEGDVLQSVGDQAALVAFSEGQPAGTVEVLMDNAVVVPLPAGVLMGGALLGCLAAGQQVVSWSRRRTPRASA